MREALDALSTPVERQKLVELTKVSLVSPPGNLFYQVLNQSTVRQPQSLQTKAGPRQVLADVLRTLARTATPPARSGLRLSALVSDQARPYRFFLD
jgi:hypothetical protein